MGKLLLVIQTGPNKCFRNTSLDAFVSIARKAVSSSLLQGSEGDIQEFLRLG